MDVRMIAHDMRTPLNALSFALASVQKATDPSEIQKGLEVATRNAKALSAIIESIIETSENGNGQLNLRETTAQELIAAAIDQIAPLAGEKHLEVRTGEIIAHAPLFVDGTRITRVLVNLLSNAVRFSPRGSQILVSAKPRSNDGRPATVFSVSDEGPGVPPQDMDRIFLEGVSLRKQSTGLGLTVCREIVEAHGGRIWIDTTRRTGATFSFSIPSPQ